jgi:hypothetical protein
MSGTDFLKEKRDRLKEKDCTPTSAIAHENSIVCVTNHWNTAHVC